MSGSELIGSEYRSIDGCRRWELLFEHVYVVILNTGVKQGRDLNLIGVDASNLRVKWVIGGVLDSTDMYDGVVNVWVRDGCLWARTWSGFSLKIDHRSGEILEQVFTKQTRVLGELCVDEKIGSVTRKPYVRAI